MGLIEEVRAHQQENRPGGKCQVREVLLQLDAKDRQELETVLASPEFQHAAISAVLKGRGIEVKEYTISRHRRNLCCCAK